jgi:hypothetical protein
MFFGKYKGCTVMEVLDYCPGYICWIIDNDKFYFPDFRKLIIMLSEFLNKFALEITKQRKILNNKPVTPVVHPNGNLPFDDNDDEDDDDVNNVVEKQQKLQDTVPSVLIVPVVPELDKPFKELYDEFIEYEAKRNPRPMIGQKIGTGKSLLELETNKFIRGENLIMGVDFLVSTTNRNKSFFENLAKKYKEQHQQQKR